MQFDEVSEHLRILAETAGQTMRLMPADHWRAKHKDWTRSEVLGHLVDSASNNHQRFARALIQDSLTFPGYEQDAMVRVQNYAAIQPRLLIELWTSYNRYLAWLFAQFPEAKLTTPCDISGWKITLGDMAVDYVAHMEHHLRQVLPGEDLPYSGMSYPWQKSNV